MLLMSSFEIDEKNTDFKAMCLQEIIFCSTYPQKNLGVHNRSNCYFFQQIVC